LYCTSKRREEEGRGKEKKGRDTEREGREEREGEEEGGVRDMPPPPVSTPGSASAKLIDVAPSVRMGSHFTVL